MPDKIGNYKIITTLGSGSFGDVYKVKNEGCVFALKHIQISSKENNATLQMEVDAHKSLPKHRNIVEFVDYFKSTFTWNIVMEFCELGNLEDYVIAHKPGTEVALSLMSDMACGLNHLHNNNIVHRDMKPENILLVPGRFGAPICKISDFGVSRFGTMPLSESGQSNGNVNQEHYFQSLCGTPYFLAPEVRNRQYTRSCDVFSLGIVFYLLFCNRPNSANKLIPWAKGGTPFYRATDDQIQDQLKLHIHNVKIYQLVCSMLDIDFHTRISAQGLVNELNTFQVSDDEVFIATLLIVALTTMLFIFPLPLFMLIFGLLFLACWEFQLLPRRAFKNMSILSYFKEDEA